MLEEGAGGEMITLYDNGAHMPLLWAHLIPATLEGRAVHNVQNAMFAAGMTYSMGVKLEDARVVVSGGRGLGGPDGFSLLVELARVLKGAVGASRATTAAD